MKLCEYGCGLEAHYVSKEGVWRCKEFPSQCPAIIKKNIGGLYKYSSKERSDRAKRVYKELPECSKQRMIWNKGLTAENNESMKRVQLAMKSMTNDPNYVNPLINWNKEHPVETRDYTSLSNTRKELYKKGLLKPAAGVGRGKFSYWIDNNGKHCLRSTYEFIYAFYLHSLNKIFEIESIRVILNNHTYISDFYVDGEVHEVKGILDDHALEHKLAFESSGYKYRFILYEDIMNFKNQLEKRGYNINHYIDLIYDGHDSGNYFVFNSLMHP